MCQCKPGTARTHTQSHGAARRASKQEQKQVCYRESPCKSTSRNTSPKAAVGTVTHCLLPGYAQGRRQPTLLSGSSCLPSFGSSGNLSWFACSFLNKQELKRMFLFPRHAVTHSRAENQHSPDKASGCTPRLLSAFLGFFNSNKDEMKLNLLFPHYVYYGIIYHLNPATLSHLLEKMKIPSTNHEFLRAVPQPLAPILQLRTCPRAQGVTLVHHPTLTPGERRAEQDLVDKIYPRMCSPHS